MTFNDGTSVRPPALTLLVGPNNSGKSQALKDIVEFTTKPTNSRLDAVVVSAVDPILPDNLGDLTDAYPNLNRVQDANGNWQYHGLHPSLVQQHTVGGGQWPNDFDGHFNSPDTLTRNGWFYQQFGPGLVGLITTEHRLQLVKESKSSEHDYAAENLLQSLYNSGSAAEQEAAELVNSVFNGQRLALDYTTLTKLRLRVATDFSDVPTDPRDAKSQMRAKPLLDDQGDGIRSYAGIVVALKTITRPLILIDEPEAFLHPPQAYAIGRLIADESAEGRQIIVATHSTDVLRGVLSVTEVAEIIRVDRIDDTNSFCQLTRETLNSILSDPLLSSARVLDALFYQSAVITEADSDCRFFHAAM